MINKLKRPTVIVTGASSGIGKSIAKFLKKKNFFVINIDKINKNKGIKYISCDLSKTKVIQKKIKTLQKEKNIIGLVNCAGITKSGESYRYKLKNWNLTLAVNLTAPFLLSQFVAKIMIKNNISGSLVNISSISSDLAMPNNPAYNSSKAALIQLTRSLAVDLAKYKIRVNSISPGYTKTPLNAKSWKNKKLRLQRTKKTLLGKWATPDDYNEAVLFLIDKKKSSYMTGSNITIDGGWSAKGM